MLNEKREKKILQAVSHQIHTFVRNVRKKLDFNQKEIKMEQMRMECFLLDQQR